MILCAGRLNGDEFFVIQITPTLAIDEREIEEVFIRAEGPGGQNVNKVSSAVQLRFDVGRSTSLPEMVKQRLKVIAGNRMTSEGVLVINARRHRTQSQNRADAQEQLADLLRRAEARPKLHIKTKPTLASKQRRLADKAQRAEKKRQRRGGSYDE
ncbi:MAG: aminoacyl-tRNA hydrolase [Anaerolineae bacterium]|nr:aminoacyl-tRNA hydrolase [Anaerolineae bacterium]